MKKYTFKLYITGQTPGSERAIANMRRLCDTELPDCELRIIDVLEQPELAELDRVLTTPTLVKEAPPPVRRVTGDLSDTHRVLLYLSVPSRTEPNSTSDDNA